MQTILVLITFAFAVFYMITKFVWNPFKTSKSGAKNKPGDHSDCSSCSFH
jgi:hypothetical protein